MNDDRRDAYLIELKGSDIEHALDQLEATAHRFKMNCVDIASNTG